MNYENQENTNNELENFTLYQMKTGKSIPMIKKRIGKSIIAIVLAASTLIPTVSAANVANISINPVTVTQLNNYTRLFINEDQLFQKSNPLLDLAIASNKNVSNYEKGIMAQFKPFIDDNPYITEKNYEKFKDVKFNYNIGSGPTSSYSKFDNTVLMSCINNDLAYHELLHCLVKGINSGYISFNGKDMITLSNEGVRKLNEGMTELITCEYTNRPKHMYFHEQTYVKIILELVGKDNMLNAYTNDNFPLIVDELSKYLEGFEQKPAKEITVDFLNLLSNYIDIFKNKSSSRGTDEKPMKTQIDAYMKYIYQNKYNNEKTVSSDLVMQNYFESMSKMGTLIYGGKEYEYTFEYAISDYYNDVKENQVTIKYKSIGSNEYNVLGTYNIQDIEKDYNNFFTSLQNDEFIDQVKEVSRQR